MRGKPGWNTSLDTRIGNIPAYAGKTPASALAKHTPAEHPRVCGENQSKYHLNYRQVGTSPRMRGKLAMALIYVAGLRNIPAYAGKTRGLGWSKYWE